jgi:hypothetical protein
MKKLFFYISLISFCGLFLLSGCTKSNPEPSPSDPRSQYIGSWGVTETPTKNFYTASISVDPNSSDGVFISNFAASTVQAHAVVSGNSITVTNQQLSNGWIVNGQGTFGSNKITWTYSINDGANLTNYIAVFAKS